MGSSRSSQSEPQSRTFDRTVLTRSSVANPGKVPKLGPSFPIRSVRARTVGVMVGGHGHMCLETRPAGSVLPAFLIWTRCAAQAPAGKPAAGVAPGWGLDALQILPVSWASSQAG